MNTVSFDGELFDPKKTNRALRVGDKVRYTVIKRISKDKAVIHFLGKRVLADIESFHPDKGVATVRNVGEKIELYFGEKKEGKSTQVARGAVVRDVPVTDEKRLLLDAGLKADARNTNYMRLVMKHLGVGLDDKKLRFIFSLIAKGIYPSVERLQLFFSRTIYFRIRSFLQGKNTKAESSSTDNLIKLTHNIMSSSFPFEDGAEKMAGLLKENGFTLVWLMLFEKANRADSEDAKMLRDFLEALGWNLKKRSGKENVITLPMFLEVGGDTELLEISVFSKEHYGQKSVVHFTAHRGEDEICDIEAKIENDMKVFSITFFDASLYSKFKVSEGELTKELSSVVTNFVLESKLKPSV